MQCPSCGHKQANNLECKRCGIIFEKYQQRQERLAKEKELAGEATSIETKRGMPGLMVGLIIGLLVGGTAFYYSSSKDTSPVDKGFIQAEGSQEIAERPERVKRERRQVASSPSWQNETSGLEGLAKQLNESHPASNAVEKARNATVFIRTSWGTGSGFFVSDNGLIITNRHVLQMNEDALNKLNEQAQQGEKALDREEKTLNYLRSQVPKVRDETMRQQLQEDIQAREQEYAKYKSLYDELLERIQTMESSSPINDVKVELINGNTYAIDSVMLSDKHDLALISINAYGAPYIASSPRISWDQGQQVYTIGNPHGLRHTVTSGVISGYRKYNGNNFIQTDAPINPGNSGGPLIDEKGIVIGVNTMIIRDTEGIGFAIPMQTVFDEFGNYMPEE